MKQSHAAFIAAFVLTFILIPIAVVLTHSTTDMALSVAGQVEAYPGPDTPWYAVGFMPVLLIGSSLALLLAVLVWAMNRTRIRRFSGGSE